MQKRINIIK